MKFTHTLLLVAAGAVLSNMGVSPEMFVSSLFAADDEIAGVPALINDLRSSSRRERHTAQARLIELGETVLPAVMAAQQTADDPMKASLLHIQQQLETQLAEKSLQGMLVTFHSSTMGGAFKKAVESLARQSRQVIRLQNSRAVEEKQIDVELEEVPFWVALQSICNAGDVGWKWTANRELEISSAIRRFPGNFAVHGAFRINAAPVSRRRTFTDPNSRKTLRIEMRIDSEAEIHPFFVSVRGDRISLTTDAEGSLLPFSPESRRDMAFDGQSARYTVDFLRNPSGRLPAGTVRGTVQIRCAARSEDLSFPILTPDAIRYSGQTRVQLLSMRASDQELTAEFSVTFAPDVVWESHQVGWLHHDVWLLAADGTRTPYSQRDVENSTGQTHEIRYRFPVDQKPADGMRLVYRAPALFTTVETPFEIELSSLGD